MKNLNPMSITLQLLFHVVVSPQHSVLLLLQLHPLLAKKFSAKQIEFFFMLKKFVTMLLRVSSIERRFVNKWKSARLLNIMIKSIEKSTVLINNREVLETAFVALLPS